MQHRSAKLLLDVKQACEEMLLFQKGVTFELYLQNKVLQLATERQFEIIGEAISRLSRIDEAKLMEIIPDYRKIIGFRNIIAHGYDVIDQVVLWDFAVNKVPELLEQVDRY